jgi:formylglycine-generating enzyme required for sulfatase activity
MGKVRRHFNFGISKVMKIGKSRKLRCIIKSCVLLFCFMLFVFCFLFSVFCSLASANNVSVTNVSITGQSTSAQTCKVEFDVSWDNSWRNAVCRDAVWVFIKYSTDSGTTWNHATLDDDSSEVTNPTGYSQGTGTGLDIIVPSDKKGAFLQRSAEGIGSVDTDDIQFIWDWGTDGLSAGDTARLKVFAIEMVYIPEGAFYAGDGGSSYDFQQGAADTDPWYVNDSADMVMNGGEFYYTSAGNSGEDATGAAFTILAAFPNGFDAFYLMKYEITQGQYRDFLNTLTQAQQNTRVEADLSNEDDANTYVLVAEDQATVSYRQTIKAGSNPADGDPYTFSCDLDDNDIGDESADGEWIACNYLSWMDVVAYADWSGLRPMTELEFEKACRGPNSPIYDEYAWGSTGSTTFSSLTNAGQTSEVSGTAGANCNSFLCSPDGPVRVGMFATANSTREQAGAGYYGVMELSGNLWERVVTVGNATGRSFTGTSGDGSLSANGNANGANGQPVSDWPGWVDATDEVTGVTGSGFRGGSWSPIPAYECVSNRNNAASIDLERYNHFGGRCARTSP